MWAMVLPLSLISQHTKVTPRCLPGALCLDRLSWRQLKDSLVKWKKWAVPFTEYSGMLILPTATSRPIHFGGAKTEKRKIVGL